MVPQKRVVLYGELRKRSKMNIKRQYSRMAILSFQCVKKHDLLIFDTLKALF